MKTAKSGKKRKSYQVKGVLTIELALLFPLLFSIFVLVVYTVFYYHDKNILIGMAGETAVLGAQMARKPGGFEEAELENFYRARVENKCILFSETNVEITKSKDAVEVAVSAQSSVGKVYTKQQAAILEPEVMIRRKEIAEELFGEEK